MRAPAFKRVNQFAADTPMRLGEQLSTFEQNVDDAFKALAVDAEESLQPTARQAAAYSAKLGDLVITDSAGGNVAVTLPVAAPGNKNRTIGIVRKSSANTVSATVASGLVNGATSSNLAARVGLFFFKSDGTGWWGTA